jgi:carboxyl-terminal processing protease
LEWDTIGSAAYKKLNLIQPILPPLQKKSAQRIDKDQDFIYLTEDIDRYKKMLADKTISLNEEQRLKEKQETEARDKARQAELKARPDAGEKVYEITLKQTDLPGLPPPVSKTNNVASAKSPHIAPAAGGEAAATVSNDDTAKADDTKSIASKEDDEDDSSTEPKVPPVDATLKEAKRILVDLISLWPRGNSVVTAN